MIEGKDLHVQYGLATALAGVDLTIGPGEVVSLVGASGSGKSTLMHCMATLQRPTSGHVLWASEDVGQWSDEARARLRREKIGFVFQFGDLVPELTLLENVTLPLLLTGQSVRKAKAAAAERLQQLGLSDSMGRRPDQVSGGQAQRAAIARALVHEPDFVFADEPTGALDTTNSTMVLDAFIGAAKELGAGVLLVTHEQSIAARADRQLTMKDGLIA